MVRTRNGDLHLLYTWNKTAIRHAWLKADAVEGAPRNNNQNRELNNVT